MIISYVVIIMHYYFSPQYLVRNGITEISRENFSFSTKVKVGNFYEVQEGPEVIVGFVASPPNKML